MISIANRDRTPLASVAIADGMDTLYNTVERKHMMMKKDANTIEKINRESQLSLMTTIKGKDQISVRKTITTPILKTTTPILNRAMVTIPVSRMRETKISIIGTTLTKDKINALNKIITTFLQDRKTTPAISITKTFLRFSSAISNNVQFNDEDSHEVINSISTFFPIICQHGNDRQILHLKNDGDEQHIEECIKDNEVLATMQDMADCFKLGKTIHQYKLL